MTPFLIDPDAPRRIRPPVPPAVFGLPVRTLDIASHWRSPATGALLAAEVGRWPRNLHTHLQRISLWASLGDGAAVAAALIDFWIVLGPYGRALRQRLLNSHAGPLAKAGLADYLAERLETGLNRYDPRIACPGSVLARPVEGHLRFLRSAPPAANLP